MHQSEEGFRSLYNDTQDHIGDLMSKVYHCVCMETELLTVVIRGDLLERSQITRMES